MAARYGRLPLDDSPRTRVFRAIDDLLRADPDLKRLFSRPGAYRSWIGQPEDKNPFGQNTAPCMRITPIPEEETHWFPGYTKGWLSIQVELLVNGLCVDDVENIHYAMVQALGPVRDKTRLCEIHRQLQAAGAVTGIIFWAMPAHDPSPDVGTDGQFRAFGRFRLEIETS
jgi:hypothetical protein